MEKEYCYDCMKSQRQYDAGRALYEYGCIRKSIYRFKYMGRQEYAEFFGKQIVEKMAEQIQKWHPDALIPIPLYSMKQRHRGYNQAELLARVIGKRMNIPVYTQLVKRVRDTKPLKELSPSERQNNLKKAFKICKDDVKLRVVILIDDIYTTGSTMNEIAVELKEVGVIKIYFITLAIGNGL